MFVGQIVELDNWGDNKQESTLSKSKEFLNVQKSSILELLTK